MLRSTDNKSLVLIAFDTLFNRRDYEAAERFWSPDYIQHSAHIAPGREGLFTLVRSLPATLRYQNALILAEDDMVMVHGRFTDNGSPAALVAVDILRISDGRLAEHWDVLQDEATREQSKSGSRCSATASRTDASFRTTETFMKLTGNTILVTGGGSGIGRGLAEALHARGNKVIIAGRRRASLDAVVAANPGIDAIELDVSDPEDIRRAASDVTASYPGLDVLFNNAGIMLPDNAAGPLDDETASREIATNFLGAIRLSGALIEHLKTRPQATILYNTSVLAFTPLAMFATYCATKAALHSYAISQRFMLRNTSVKVQEIAPPWVGTDLIGQPDHPAAMPLAAFIEATMVALASDDEEVLVPEARPLRDNAGPGEHAFTTQFNGQMAEMFGA